MGDAPNRLCQMVETHWTPAHAMELLAYCDDDHSRADALLDVAHSQAHRGINRIVDLREHTGRPVGLTEAIEAHKVVCDEIRRGRALLREVADAHGIRTVPQHQAGGA